MMMMNSQTAFPQNGGGMMGQGTASTSNEGLNNASTNSNNSTSNNNDGSNNPNANSVSAFLRSNPGMGGAQGMMGMAGMGMGGAAGAAGGNAGNSMMNAMNINAMNMNNPAQAAMNMNGMNFTNFNLNELKRIQNLQMQLQQQAAGSGNNNPNNNAGQNPLLAQQSAAHQQQDPSAAILQNYLDQKIQSSRFGDFGMAGMGGLQGAAGLQGQNPMLGGANLLMMNQGGLGGIGTGVGIGGVGGVSNDVPLPPPHSLFHRDGSRRMRGGVIEPFPEKLHRLLLEVEAAGRGDVISFVANGRAFAIHKPDKFFKEIVPLYFRQSRLSSFKRQLNLYGFELINTGPARGGYYHELFVKDRPELCRRMRRVAVKVTPKAADPSDVSKEKAEVADSTGVSALIGEDLENTADNTEELSPKEEGEDITAEAHSGDPKKSAETADVVGKEEIDMPTEPAESEQAEAISA